MKKKGTQQFFTKFYFLGEPKKEKNGYCQCEDRSDAADQQRSEPLQLVIDLDQDFDLSLVLGHANIGQGQGPDVSEGAQNHFLYLDFEAAVNGEAKLYTKKW